jgi:FHA domain-containing protein
VEEYRTVVVASGAAVFAIIFVAIVVAIVRRRRRARAMQAPLPLIPFSAGRAAAGPPRPDGLLSPPPRHSSDLANAPTPAWNGTISDTPQNHVRSPYAPPAAAAPAEVRAPARQALVPNNALAETARPNELVDGEAVDGASVRYWRPADGTLQFLPGRLEVIAGRDAGQEIRFVRTPGPDGTRVTFGRAEGAPYRHVQLREPTVSRTHARMTLEASAGNSNRMPSDSGRWRLENLSATNPVVVNGRPLAADGSAAGSVSLGEGDRIEMGEVVFRFHEK